MLRRLTPLLVVALLAGCGSDSKKGGPGADDGAPAPSGQGAPVDTSGQEEAYQEAVAAFEEDDFDKAIPAMESLAGYRDAEQRAKQFRVKAAKTMIRIARKKLETGPQASVVQLQTSIRYHPTPEAEALLVVAKRKLAAFKKKEEAKRARAKAKAEAESG